MKMRKFAFSQPEIMEMMGFPGTTLGKGPTLECLSDREGIVDGCMGILEYTEDVIRLSVKDMTLRFTGDELFIGAMEKRGLVIKGRIHSIEFVR